MFKNCSKHNEESLLALDRLFYDVNSQYSLFGKHEFSEACTAYDSLQGSENMS